MNFNEYLSAVNKTWKEADGLQELSHCRLALLEEVGELDHLFVCVSGGGLISGSILAAQELSPNCLVHGVEPNAANDAQQSIERGEIIKITPPQTIADGAVAP